jgi:DtxR family transcriptional regulator, Mn-dependent transcriptional regulator
MPSRTVEDYLKTIFQVAENSEYKDNLITTSTISNSLKLTAGTVTMMLKQLEKQGLADYHPRKGVRLTKKGRLHALKMIRRHRLIELFLLEHLGYSWEEVHAEAEELEHAVSDIFISRLDKLLNYPRYDPHGSPIPSDSGEVDEVESTLPLAHSLGGRVKLLRVTTRSNSRLKWFRELNLKRGKVFKVIRNDTQAETITICIDNVEQVLSREIGMEILVCKI